MSTKIWPSEGEEPMYPGTLLMVMHVGFSSSCGYRHLGVFEDLTNDEHPGNIWGYASKYGDRLIGKLPVTKMWKNNKIS